MGELLLLRELQQDLCTPEVLRRRKGSDVPETKTSAQKPGVYAIPQCISLSKPRSLQNTDDRSMDSGCESRWKKMIGKPYSGKLNVRFDEGELETADRYRSRHDWRLDLLDTMSK